MRSHGRYSPGRLTVDVWAYRSKGDGSRYVERIGEDGRRGTQDHVAEGVEARPTLSVPHDTAVALRDGLTEALGEPKRDERIAALEAEVRLLREWLTAERERSDHPPMTITPPTLDCKKVEAIIEEFRRERPNR